MGATRFQTATRVVVPGALSGIAAAYILGISRAVGETMVVAIAAGLQPNLTWDPTQPAATITAFIVQVSLGDLPHGSIGYQSIFAAGMVLFVMTMAFNVLGWRHAEEFVEASNDFDVRRDVADTPADAVVERRAGRRKHQTRRQEAHRVLEHREIA